MNFHRILVPIDFSSESLKAYEVAKAQFGDQGKTIILLHVMESISSDVENDPQVGMRFVDERDRKLKALVEGEPNQWADVEIVIIAGKSVDRIVQTALDQRADLVVMGAHGTSGLVEGLFGSTTYNVTRKLHCSVLVVK